MKIVSWNVNGLMACKRKGFLKYLVNSKADVFCCQEIKTRCPLQTPGYQQFWNPSRRPGYSGTLTLAKREPLSVTYGMGIEQFDAEGRMVTLEYEAYYIINLYVPNSQGSPERQRYRAAWDAALLDYLSRLAKPAILCGDFNVARDYIDIYPENLRNEEHPPGFQSEEREGMERLIGAGYLDMFRELYPNQEGAYTWWSNRLNKRLENRGWRLDYFLVAAPLAELVRDAAHHPDVLGSDHCPISLTLYNRTVRREVNGEDMEAMWRGIDWERMEDQLLDLQQQIARTAYAESWNKVEELQKKLVRSLAAKVLAVRQVAQTGAEPGIDGVRWRTDEEKMRAALSLTSKGYRAKPYRHLTIDEDGKERNIHVPVAYDKAMQTLYAFSLDPVAESVGDKKSFAFRKGRSAFDAHAYICKALDGEDAPRWILRADVKSCYDSISHRWLLKNVRMDKKVLHEFLRAGVMSGGELFPTTQGISQGASLSPILGNLVLDGLQAYIYEKLYPEGQTDYLNGNLIRFADDIIVTCRDIDTAKQVREIVSEFLIVRGLDLHPEKTYVSNVDLGFEFLSRHYQNREGVLIVRPSEKAVIQFERRLENFILGFHGSQKTLIEKLNRKLSGWANYHRITDVEMAFRRIDSVVQSLLARKMRQLHPSRQWKSIVNKYWRLDTEERRVFSLPNDPTEHVIRLANIHPTDHKPVRVNFHPYLDQEYYAWLQNKRDIQKVSGAKHRAVWERQEGKCAYCGQPMLADQELELIERIVGYGRRVQNLCYIHRRCYYDTVSDGDELAAEHLDLFALLDGVTEHTTGDDSPYWELKEFFRLCEKSPVTLTFAQIEEFIGEPLPWEAHFYEAFWLDEHPGMDGELWAREYPFHAVKPSRRDWCISDTWLSQGYRIKRLRLQERRVAFRRDTEGISGLAIPKALTDRKLPDKAVFELKQFFAYIIRKYGL